MIKQLAVAFIAAGALLCAGQASAAQFFNFRLVGTLTEQLGSPDDPTLKVGDQIVMTARISTDRIASWGSHGYDVAATWLGFYGTALPDVGEEFFRIDGPGVLWNARSDELDGSLEYYSESYSAGPLCCTERHFSGPAIAFADGKIRGLGNQVDMYAHTAPILRPGTTMGHGLVDIGYDPDSNIIQYESFIPFIFSPDFTIAWNNPCLYGMCRYTPGFKGVWDFDGSYAAIPEPESWAMLLLGFFALGGALRVRPSRLMRA
jgi:hypothetical protein